MLGARRGNCWRSTPLTYSGTHVVYTGCGTALSSNDLQLSLFRVKCRQTFSAAGRGMTTVWSGETRSDSVCSITNNLYLKKYLKQLQDGNID